MFKDGWVPPEVIAGKDVSNLSAAIAANAAAVAQLNDGSRKVRQVIEETFQRRNFLSWFVTILVPFWYHFVVETNCAFYWESQDSVLL